MNKVLKFVSVLTISILLQSCIDLGIYISDFPLNSSDTEPADIKLVGHWKKVSGKDKSIEMKTLEFILFNDNEYIMRTRDQTDKSLVRVFITTISGVSFLNLQELSGTEQQYVFCKYSMNDKDELTLTFVGDTLFDSYKPETSKKLRKFIKKNLGNPELFDKEMGFTFKKVNEL